MKSEMKIDKSILGIAGEFAVAAELCRRNMYAQLTLGHLKRTDLLVFSEETHKLVRIEVKSKQGREFPNCKGIYGQNVFLVFVDYQGKDEEEPPDFYILSVADWVAHVKQCEKVYRGKHPDRRTTIDEYNCLVLLDEVSNKQPYRGCSVLSKDIREHKGDWKKISGFLGIVSK